MELWERTTWLNKSIEYLFGDTIVEYDMKSAGLSLSKKFNLLPEDVIRDLENTPKKERNIKMGLIQRKDKAYTQALLDAFKEQRKEFFEANNLGEDNLLSIKKDAFFTINTKCHHTEFGDVRFDSKNKYTSYIYLNKLEFYLNTRNKVVDIKGLGQGEDLDAIRKLHKDYMLNFMLKYVRMKELGVTGNPMDRFLVDFVTKYRNKELDVGYYRQLSKLNGYLVYDEISGDWNNVQYFSDLTYTDINYNYFNYIVKMVGISI